MNSMMMERGMPMPGMGMSGMPGMPMSGMGMPGMMGMNMMMAPKATMTMEKCEGGMKMMCRCDDAMSAAMLQSLCTMMAGGMCSIMMMMNGMPMCCCNMTMGMCKMEMMEDGMMMTCTSGDMDTCNMIQACCDCMSMMMASGCTCCMMMNGTPVCCG